MLKMAKCLLVSVGLWSLSRCKWKRLTQAITAVVSRCLKSV